MKDMPLAGEDGVCAADLYMCTAGYQEFLDHYLTVAYLAHCQLGDMFCQLLSQFPPPTGPCHKAMQGMLLRKAHC